jgi:hypothetical protein
MPAKTDFYASTYEAGLTRQQKRVLIAMHDAGEFSSESVGSLIGGEAAARPPLVRLFIHRIRKKLAGTGWTISSNRGGNGHGGVYKVIRSE